MDEIQQKQIAFEVLRRLNRLKYFYGDTIDGAIYNVLTQFGHSKDLTDIQTIKSEVVGALQRLGYV